MTGLIVGPTGGERHPSLIDTYAESYSVNTSWVKQLYHELVEKNDTIWRNECFVVTAGF